MVQEPACKLWVIQRVAELALEFKPYAFGDREPLDEAKIQVIRRTKRKRVPATAGECSRTGYNVFRIRIVCNVRRDCGICISISLCVRYRHRNRSTARIDCTHVG